eukprot:TRINITY_DN19733_c0_g3_i1.p2 TRINITY_DN19733_c0_g3~~TRINITY_DN19733_c0_g3_i1.p2  ORF type:complete len:493 (+),score=185.57 TRINITY_DN19733_c0_g3_i1:57-1481(+)
MAAADPLAAPLTLPCGLRLKNRMVKAAMTECLSTDAALASVDLERLYRAWAAGGCGLLLTGNVQVDRRYLERPGNVCIDGPQDEAQLAALRGYARAAQENGAKAVVQLSHAGRQATAKVARASPAPSAIPSKALVPVAAPYEMATEEVRAVVAAFAHAARVAQDAGFDGVQVHAAHGYLLSSFLSPLANRRTDVYGGSLENRARALLETIRACRAATARPGGAPFAVGVKINSSDFQRGGFTHEEALVVAKWLDGAGVDFVELSGGNYESPALMTGTDSQLRDILSVKGVGKRATRDREAYFMEYARDVRAALTRTPLMVTGGFRTRRVMEAALADIDLIGVARPLCVDPACVQRVLDRDADALPCLETEWALPWGTQWLQYVVIGNLLSIAGQQAATYCNLRYAGAGRPMERAPNLLWALVAQEVVDYRKAHAVREGLADHPTLQPRHAWVRRVAVCLALAAAALFVWRRVRG